MYRILVTGDRKWSDDEYPVVFEAIDKARNDAKTNNIMVIHGGAKGADKLGGMAAFRLDFGIQVHPANWNKFGKGAGPIRNSQMLRENHIDMVLAFHDDLGNSKGTKDMVTKALEAGIPVRHYRSDGHYVELKQEKLGMET